MKTVYLLHGFGVRSFFWDLLRPRLSETFDSVLAPDVDAESFDAYCTAIEEAAIERRDSDGEPVCLCGHSLGALVAAAVAHRTGKAVVDRVILIAPPGSSTATAVSPVLRFLLRNRLIPSFLIRPRFFAQTPASVQKRLFERAVVEPDGLQDDVYLRRTELVKELAHPLPQAGLVLASDADQIAPSEDSVRLAHELGAEVHRFSREERVGHDDYATAPAVVRAVAERISAFCGR